MSFEPPLSANEQIYKYLLIIGIGSGSHGEIWLARDNSINREVAVKILDSSQTTLDEHIQEAHRGNIMDHDNLVKIHYADVVERNGIDIVLIVMDHISHGCVLNKLNAANYLPIKTALPIMIDVLRGLEFLHEQDIYHNDIKPKNILIGNNGEGILTDYGISVAGAGQSHVTPGSAYRLHVAPELIQNNHINIQTDIYQAGLTLFRLLNGIGKLRDKLNASSDVNEYFQMVTQGKLIRPSDYLPFIPRNLKSIISKATHFDPTKRFQTVLEMRRSLERLSYAADWTSTMNGAYIAECQNNTYRYEENNIGNGQFDFTAFKKNKKSQHERRIGPLTKTKITKLEAEKTKREFMQKIVMGN